METTSNSTRVIDISTTELASIVESTVKKVLDARLPKPPPIYYTVKDLEPMLGCSKVTIYKLANEGKLSYRRLTGTHKIRFTQEDIDEFLKLNPGFSTKRSKPER